MMVFHSAHMLNSKDKEIFLKFWRKAALSNNVFPVATVSNGHQMTPFEADIFHLLWEIQGNSGLVCLIDSEIESWSGVWAQHQAEFLKGWNFIQQSWGVPNRYAVIQKIPTFDASGYWWMNFVVFLMFWFLALSVYLGRQGWAARMEIKRWNGRCIVSDLLDNKKVK